jgi:hypothetical protein
MVEEIKATDLENKTFAEIKSKVEDIIDSFITKKFRETPYDSK